MDENTITSQEVENPSSYYSRSYTMIHTVPLSLLECVIAYFLTRWIGNLKARKVRITSDFLYCYVKDILTTSIKPQLNPALVEEFFLPKYYKYVHPNVVSTSTGIPGIYYCCLCGIIINCSSHPHTGSTNYLPYGNEGIHETNTDKELHHQQKKKKLTLTSNNFACNCIKNRYAMIQDSVKVLTHTLQDPRNASQLAKYDLLKKTLIPDDSLLTTTTSLIFPFEYLKSIQDPRITMKKLCFKCLALMNALTADMK